MNKNLIVVGKAGQQSNWLRRQSTAPLGSQTELGGIMGGQHEVIDSPRLGPNSNWSNQPLTQTMDLKASTLSASGSGQIMINNSQEPESARKVSMAENEQELGHSDTIYNQIEDRKHISWKVPSPATMVM